ncbi:MAG: SAM-dependent methyltransferase [Thermodesulfobacteriota bacterium]
MPVDFRDAAERHWEDAEYLMADTRTANADHLYGLSAECALKAVMLALGMALRPDGAPDDRRHRVHINQLWNEFESFADSRNGACYASKLADVPNPFMDWDVNQRYDQRTGITPAVAETHKQGARTTRQILDSAVLNGDIK